MDIINKIISEEINRFILSEAIDFSNLRYYSNQLNKAIGGLRNLNSNGFNDELKEFFKDLSIYGIQIIAAINRCVQGNNLNEVRFGGLRDYGINLPAELGGNFWSDAKEGYWKTARYMNGYGNGGGRGGYASGSRRNSNGRAALVMNNNTVSSEKLSVLLQELPRWQQTYRAMDAKYNIGNLTQEPYVILGQIIPNIETEYNTQMQNAQGTNP